MSSNWDPLGPPVVGASGPVARAASQVYEATFTFHKEVSHTPSLLPPSLPPSLPLRKLACVL
eukprot:208494-Hanusia_phi.AAC.2